MKKSIYLDFNATGMLRPEVREALISHLDQDGNPSSVHQRGRAARALLEQARDQVAQLAGASAAKIIFPSGGTEANNQAIRGVKAASILISATEHDSTIAAAYAAGAEVQEIPVGGEGLLDLKALEKALKSAKKPVLVSVMLANNETGVIQPVGKIAEIAHRHGALMHSDAIQAAGKIPVDFEALDVDLMTLSAHKINSIGGAAALIFKPSVSLNPIIFGGGQEQGWRSGTENVAGIGAFGAAAELAHGELEKYSRISELRDYLEEEILTFCRAARVFGSGAPRLPNTSKILMPQVTAETQVMAFDLEGFCVSAGSACSSGKVKTSYVLRAMGAPDYQAGCAIRVSMGWQTTKADVTAFIAAWKRLYQRTHGKGS